MSEVSRKDFFSFIGYLEREGYVIVSTENSLFVETSDSEINLERFRGRLSAVSSECIHKFGLKIDFDFGEIFEYKLGTYRIPLIISEKTRSGIDMSGENYLSGV